MLLQDEGTASEGDFGLAEFFAEDVSLTTFVPISYTLRNLEGNTVAGVGETANYSVMECTQIGESILSDFEESDDDWTAANARAQDPIQANNASVARVGTGYLYAGDGNGSVTYFIAPENFRGDKSAYVGGTLSYWLEWDIGAGVSAGTPINSLSWPDVEITGVSTPLVLVWSAGVDDWAEDVWILHELDLVPNPSLRVYTAGEGIGTAVEATEEQIAEVLADVAGIRLRGEHRSGPADFTRIDHVLLVPGPNQP